jgi:hypothetical protein
MTVPTPIILQGQLDLVANYADLRADRAREIVAQMSPQYAFWSSVVPLFPARHQKTLEVVRLVLQLAKYAEMNFKHAFGVLRPHELSPQIQPLIQTPVHASFPSGHCTEAHAVAVVLGSLVNTAGAAAATVQRLTEQLMRQAARIAINRTVAGVHYPVDSMAGQLLGLAIGDYFIERATGATGSVNGWAFDGTAFPAAGDFTGGELFNFAAGAMVNPLPNYVTQDPPVPVAMGPMLNWLWNQAVAEW